MATIFKPLPRHPTVINLFQKPNEYQQEQHPLQNADLLAAAGLSTEQYDDSMDESFTHSIASQDQVPDHIHDGDLSFATTISLNSPASPPSFQHMESSPYGMDICSPSPGHPLFGQRGNHNYIKSNSMSSGLQSFGKELSKDSDFLLAPPRSNLPASLLSRLTAGEKNSSPMTTGSVRSNGSMRSGKVGSIKSVAGSRDNSLAKGRAPPRSAIPSSWMAQPLDLRSTSNDPSEEIGDISMEDAMEVDSPLQARRPPKAELKPRPLSLFIPTTSSSFDVATQGDLGASPVPRSTLAGYPSNQDQFAAHFYDTPETQRTSYSSVDEFGFRLNNPFGNGLGEAPSSPIASPSSDRHGRCRSAVLPSSFSLASAASIDSGSESTSNRGPLSAHPLGIGRNAERPTSRIPKYTANRPGISTVVNASKNSPNDIQVHSANAVPSARMASINPRRAFSAFIKPEQLHSAPYPGARGTRMDNGVPKGRVVSMLETVGGTDDSDDFSGAENTFDSPSVGRAATAGHRRVKSKGLNEGQKYGSLRSRLPTHHSASNISVNGHAPANPSPLKPLLPFGDGEHSGKILPCHSVKDDGLMRITPSTMRALLAGAYNAQISSYQIIDCRFGFEFEGGHIAGAVNLNKDEEIERYLFADVEQRGQLPPPSQSGDGLTGKHVLIFHCEFSAKRGPTFAKHFRAKDRVKNVVEYPKLHYPELYILEGGYCSFFSAYPEHCEPRGYVQMDAPQHSHARAADLGEFRRWNRTRSYTYGDHTQPPPPNGLGIRPSQSAGNNQYQRSTLPPPADRVLGALKTHSRPQSFHELHTLQEDHATPEEGEDEDEEDDDQESHQDQEDAVSVGTLTGTEGEFEQFLQDDDLEASLGLSGSVNETPASQAPTESQEEQAEEEEEEEEDDDLGHVDSSPCVAAEIKKGKRGGKPFFSRGFKPISFGKPLGLSLLPPNRSRGLGRTASSVV